MKRARLKMGFLFQTTFCCSGNLVPSPVRRGKVRMGASYTSQHKFLPNYRHSRAGGNPLLNLGDCFSNISFLEFTMDSRLRGNDDSRVFGVICL